MQGLSGWETSKADYKKQGMSEQEAEAQIVNGFLK